MRSGLFRLLVLVFLCMSSVVMAQGYDIYTDEYGDIYVKAPDKLVILPQRKATPIRIPAPNGLMRLFEVNGEWQVQLLSQAEWDLLKLTPGHDQIDEVKKGDFDGDGIDDLLLALHHVTATQLLLSNLHNSPTIESAYFERMELTGGVGQDRPVFSTFAALSTTTTVGLSAGEFRVDESGNATYSMPLALPEGIAGVKPQMSFSYSSAAGDGYMGAGWSLSGASAITRCAKNLAVDLVQDNVAFAASDRLCLDGQRLVKNGASHDKAVSDASYWAQATEFHTELDGFVTVRQHGVAAQGPRAFTVETKSGEIHYYGDVTAVTGTEKDGMGRPLSIALKNASSGVETGEDAFFDTAAGSNIARLWALKAIKDVKGNYILFKYTEDQSLGEHYLAEVHYTGRSGGAAPFAKVVLNYVDNTKIATGWQAQSRVAMTKLLDTVSVLADGALYRQYKLNYFNTNVLEEKNYLLSVQECAGTNASQCLEPTRFEWNRPSAVSTSYTEYCENSYGLPSYCWLKPATENYSPFGTFAQLKGSSVSRYVQKVMDINGDGFADLVYPRAGSWRVRLGGNGAAAWGSSCTTPTGEPTQCKSIPALGSYNTELTLSSVGVDKPQFAQTIDYNGDGLRDLLVADSAGSNWTILAFTPSTNAAVPCTSYPSTDLCAGHIVTSSYTSIALSGKLAIGLEGGAMVADYDGDGLEDIVFIDNGVFQAYQNKGLNTAGAHLGFEHKANLGLVHADTSQMHFVVNFYSADIKSAASVDVNGDGRTDILVKVAEARCTYSDGTVIPDMDEAECRYEGLRWASYSTYRLYTSNGTGYVMTQDIGNYTNLRAADFNADGYTDVMFQTGSNWNYRLSNGKTLLAARNTGLAVTANLTDSTYLLDVNGDGRTDVLFPTSTTNWNIMLSRPTKSHEQIALEKRGTRSFDNGAAIQFADMDADGKLDLLTSTNDAGWKIYLNNRAHVKDHSVRKIINGLGASSVVEYQTIADRNVYFRQNSGNNTNSDYFSPRSGMYVVSKVSSEVKANSFVSVNYAYGGLLLHKKGRGLLGFEVLRTTDNQTDVITETVYHQHWPYTGIPKSTLQKRNAVVLSGASNTVAQAATSSGGVFPYISGSEEKSFSLNNTLTASTHLATTASSFVYDTYGNLTSSAVTISDPANAANKLLTNTSNTFTASAAYQRYGRLTASTVRKRLYVNNAVTSDISRQSSFTYNDDYLLETEVFAPNLAAAKSTTTYGYDLAGNKTSVKVNAGTDRTSSSVYTDNFRYLLSSTDVMGNVSNYKYNGVAAASFTPTLITSITAVSPNNQSSTTNFDAFGQSSSSSVKGALSGDIAVTGTVTKSFCASCEPLFPDAAIKVVTSSVTGAEQQQFIDKYGREVGSKTKLPVSGLYSVIRKTYDSQGRPYHIYEPATGAVSSYFSRVSYDELGRAIQTTMANGGVSKVDYSGYTTTQTDALLKTKSSTANYLGQTVSTTDHNGSVLSFTYNAYGDLLTASFAGVTRVSNSYDDYGRKYAMTDVDKGSWSYVSNGFGELISQTNAKAQTTTFEYNKAGQMLRRYDASGTVCWSYGSSAAAYNVNQLVGVKQWTASNTDCNSTATPVYAESYSFNSKALVSSKTISTGGANYTTTSTYDSYGRPYELTYPSSGAISGPKIRTEYSFGAAYKTTDYSTGSAGTVYHLTTAVSARGQSTGVTYGNGVTASFSYGDDTGWLKGNAVTKAGATIQSYQYDFDDVGNVTSRQLGYGVGSSANLTETFGYDNLHRLTSRTVNSALNLSGALAMTESYGYDAMGNLTSKPGVGSYSFSYDANGNVTNDSKRTFTYTAFEKPSRIQQNNDYTDFEYGPNRELIKRIDKRGNNITTTLMLDGYEQITLPTGVVEHKYSVGEAIITKRSNGANETYYLHKDQQGSTTAITNAAGNTVQQLMYDPWGKQYVVNTSLLTYTSPAQSKGYTGHEMVNDFEVIHMGGRTYNPVLGRFMQADPFIQSPTNLQSYNRYSYVLNNPMSYTDPSGYFFKKIGSFLKKYWKPILAVVATVVTYGAASGWAYGWGMTQGFSMTVMGTTSTFVTGLSTAGAITAGAISGAVGGFVGGALATGSVTGALRGAASGAIAGAAGGYANFGDVSGWGDATKRVAVSAAGGCAAGEASGGSCSKGARIAAMVQALTMGANETYKKVSAKYNKTGEPHLWQEGQSDVGKQLDPLDAKKYASGLLKAKDVPLAYDKSTFMQAIGKGPFMDAFAEFHDGLHSAPYNWPADQFSLIATMPPSYALTVMAAMKPYSYYYYVDLLDERRK